MVLKVLNELGPKEDLRIDKKWTQTDCLPPATAHIQYRLRPAVSFAIQFPRSSITSTSRTISYAPSAPHPNLLARPFLRCIVHNIHKCERHREVDTNDGMLSEEESTTNDDKIYSDILWSILCIFNVFSIKHHIFSLIRF